MKVLNHMGGTELALTRAILIRESNSGGNGMREAIASIHRVERDRNGHPALGAGEFLNTSGLRTLVSSLLPEQGIKFIDGRVLANGAEGVMWWRPAQTTMVWFKTNETADGIGEAHGRVPLPSLVFFAGAKGWFVFAVKGNERPNRDTPLFQAGMYNVWSDGKICVGNANIPRAHNVEDIDGYERAFFESQFTHPNVHVARQLTAYRGGAGALWKKLLAGKSRQFPEQSLVPLKKNLGQWLTGITGRSAR